MKIIPALSLKDGRIVTADDGRYSYLRNSDGQYRSPVNVLRELDTATQEVFVLDIDGIERNRPNLTVVKRIAAHRNVWLDAGTRDADSMMDLFVSDAGMVALGTASLDSLAELRLALEMSESIIVSISYDGGILHQGQKFVGPEMDEFLVEIKAMTHIRTGMLFDMGSVRSRSPPDAEMTTKLADIFDDLYVCGHITASDLVALEAAGAAGAIMDFRKMEVGLDRA